MLVFFAAALAAITQPPSSEPATAAPEGPAPEAVATEGAVAEFPVLESGVPWWEKITVTLDDKGKQHSCLYQTSLSGKGAEACDKEMADSVQAGVKGQSGTYSKVTFERRFSPGGRLDSGRLHPGDTLLGRQVMYLTFTADGSIESCKVVATAGDAAPDYDCDEAKKEQFKAQASADPASRQAFMTVLAYGHSEQIA
ncbi:MAG TPA: hypothetical protein VFR60_03505 [Sphingomicrobium sp.]|nr:hypothetical protein [Sphingomicrobium sp.]